MRKNCSTRTRKRIWRNFHVLFTAIRRYKWRYLFGIFFLVCTSAGQLFIPQMLRVSVDLLGTGDFLLQDIIGKVILLVGLALFIAACRFVWRFLIQGSAQRVERDLRDVLFSRLLTFSSHFYDEFRTGDLMAHITNDLDAVKQACGWGLVSFVDGLFLSTAIFIILFSQHPRLAMYIVMPFPVIIVIMLWLGKYMKRSFYQVQKSFSHLTETGREAVTGIKVIKSMVKESYFLQRFMKVNLQYQRKNLLYVRSWGMLFPLITLIEGIAIFILLYAGGTAVINGNLSTGEFIATIAYLGMLVWPMMGAGFTVNIFSRASASLVRINNLINKEATLKEGSCVYAATKDIVIKDLSYYYPSSDKAVLSHINMRIPWGNTVGILGRTASGKTTLIKCFSRMLDPPSGAVFLGDKGVDMYRISALRKFFSYVPQDTYLFSASIRENITFARVSCNQKQVQRVADIASILSDIQHLPKGFNTLVGERGVNLSGGQQQRIAIARALLADADILILDDALSAVDVESEERILSKILHLRKDKTNIIVSHRIAALMRSDVIYVLEEGKIIQVGTPHVLLHQEGLFQKIYTLQHMINDYHE